MTFILKNNTLRMSYAFISAHVHRQSMRIVLPSRKEVNGMKDYGRWSLSGTYTELKENISDERARLPWESKPLLFTEDSYPINIVKDNQDGTVDYQLAIDKFPYFQRLCIQLYGSFDLPKNPLETYIRDFHGLK